jgi:uncharacterized protein (DUF1810 family)
MDDAHELERFVQAQAPVYEQVLDELRAGRKRSHWMWFIFPQLRGLGSSSTAQRFGIASLAEARAYLAHPLLGARLRECAALANAIPGHDATAAFGSPDDLKLRSCATLFLFAAAGTDEAAAELFGQLLEKFFAGGEDPLTRELLS